MEGERAGFMKVRREQEKGLALLRNDDKYNEKIEKSKAQVGKLKEECKTLFAKIGENERQLLRVTDFFEALGERTDRMPAAVAPEEYEADMKTAGNLETLEAA